MFCDAMHLLGDGMVRTFFWYALGWMFLFLTYPVLLAVKILVKTGRLKQSDDLTDRFTRWLARQLFYITGSAICVSGQENVPGDEPVLFVSNHQSHMDSVIIHGFICKPKGFVSIIEVLKVPVIRTWMRFMKCVFLDRSNIRQSLGCLEQCVEILKQGHSMVIFPEGKLNEGGPVAEFKKGCLKVAQKAGVAIVPVTLRNSYTVMNKNGSRIKAAAVECIISGPVHVKDAGNSEKELMNTVREIIVSKL